MIGGASCVGCASPCLGDRARDRAKAAAVSTLHREAQPTERHFERAAEILHLARRRSISRARAAVLQSSPIPPVALTRLARHEAGHSVVALDLGQEIGAVNVDGDASAQCGQARDWRDAVMVDCAGMVAENGRNGVRSTVQAHRIDFAIRVARGGGPGHGCDVCHAVRAIIEAKPDATVAHVTDTLDDLHRQAFTRVQGRLWPAIERVADALVARGHLSGTEVAELVRTE